jgi:hypothetical protein
LTPRRVERSARRVTNVNLKGKRFPLHFTIDSAASFSMFFSKGSATFVKVNDGPIVISSHGRGRGTTVSISLPCFTNAPSESAMLVNE